MVNAKEFRIGNVVLDKFGKTIIIESINESGMNLRGGDGNGVYPDFGFEEIFKIPLTEEILLKCGFELFSSGSYCKNLITDNDAYLAFDLKYNNGFCWLNIRYGKVENTTKISCFYVHQLQNLYFALTNEELIVNL